MIPTFGSFFMVNVGQYTIHGSYQLGRFSGSSMILLILLSDIRVAVFSRTCGKCCCPASAAKRWLCVLENEQSSKSCLENTSLNEDVHPPKTNMDPEKGPFSERKSIYKENQFVGSNIQVLIFFLLKNVKRMRC